MSEIQNKDSLTCEEYYQYLIEKYPVESFVLEGKNREKIIFRRGRGIFSYMNKEEILCYFLEGPSKYNPEKKEIYSSFIIDPNKKEFSIHTRFDYGRRGYARAIYNERLEILRKLRIEDGDAYEIIINNHHPDEKNFLNKMKAEELVRKTQRNPDLDNALSILEEFSNISTPIRLREINDIIEYSIISKVPMEKIAEVLNKNGLHFWDSFNTESKEINRFKNFAIKGLKPLAMEKHGHFRKTDIQRSFKFMNMLGEVSEKDVFDEFIYIWNDIDRIKDAKVNKESDLARYSYIDEYCKKIDEYGKLGFMILEYEDLGLLFKYANPELKELVKRQAVNMFGLFNTDYNKDKILKVLSQAGLVDKETYIELYKKALGLNLSLEDFNSIMHRHSSYELRCEAEDEIRKHLFLPCPKNKKWQKSDKYGENYRIKKIEFPRKMAKKGTEIKKLKELLRQKECDARKIKAMTDMPKEKDGLKVKSYVDNVYDWLFGVTVSKGYLQISSSEKGTFINLPPQTPKEVVEVIKKAIKLREDPCFGEY